MKRRLSIGLTLSVMISVIVACSKDDNKASSVSPTKVTLNSIQGTWDLTKVINSDGSTSSYTGLCANNRDYFEIFAYRKIVSYIHLSSCATLNNSHGCDDFILYEDSSTMGSCNSTFDGKLTLTDPHTLRIDYDAPRNSDIPALQGAKGIILTK